MAEIDRNQDWENNVADNGYIATCCSNYERSKLVNFYRSGCTCRGSKFAGMKESNKSEVGIKGVILKINNCTN